MKLITALILLITFSACSSAPLVEVEDGSCKNNEGRIICKKIKDL